MTPAEIIRLVTEQSPRAGAVDAEALKRELQGVDADPRIAEYFLALAGRDGTLAEAGNSSLAYVLAITDAMPTPRGPSPLLFEQDAPDVDVDFPDNRRDEAFAYLQYVYGTQNVAKLGTVATFQAQSAMNEAAAALLVPKLECERLMERMMKRVGAEAPLAEMLQSPDGRAFLGRHPAMAVAARLENHPRHAGQHPAGVIVTEHPVSRYAGIDSRSGAAQADKRDAEALGLLKLDLLGVTQLSVFADALALCGLPHDHLDRIPTDDAAAYQVLNDRKLCGIFQFTGNTLRGVASRIEFRTIEDIAAVSALARPGPLAGGGTDRWIARKQGTQPVAYPHPLWEPITKSTLGIVTYQEQILRLAREVGGLSWSDATGLRKAISKSAGSAVVAGYGNAWKAGARARGVPQAVCDAGWDEIVTFGSYGFVRAHSVAYALVSYRCAWLKAHHPFEFAAASLTHIQETERQIEMLRELEAEGVGYLPTHPKLSTDVWQMAMVDGRRTLVGPVGNIKGIGAKTVRAIMSARARGEKLPDAAMKKLANPETKLDTIWPVRDRVRALLPDPADHGIASHVSLVRSLLESTGRFEATLICTLIKPKIIDENGPEQVAGRRGARLAGPCTTSLRVTLKDDTGELLGKVGVEDYPTLGVDALAHGKPGSQLFVVQGEMWGRSMRGMTIKRLQHVGPVTEEKAKFSANSPSDLRGPVKADRSRIKRAEPAPAPAGATAHISDHTAKSHSDLRDDPPF